MMYAIFEGRITKHQIPASSGKDSKIMGQRQTIHEDSPENAKGQKPQASRI